MQLIHGLVLALDFRVELADPDSEHYFAVLERLFGVFLVLVLGLERVELLLEVVEGVFQLVELALVLLEGLLEVLFLGLLELEKLGFCLVELGGVFLVFAALSGLVLLPPDRLRKPHFAVV
jgi:hypothetical protein